MNIIVNGLDLTNNKSVLLLAPDQLSEGELFLLKQTLDREFPGCKFVLLSGDFKAIATANSHIHYEIES